MNPPNPRPQPHTASGTGAPSSPARILVELDPAEALALLAGAGYGRVVFTQHAMPAIRPVNHLIDDNHIIIRTRLSAALSTAVRTPDPVVAYQADAIDAASHLGWSVVVTGLARPITDPDRITRYRTLLRPWVNQPVDTIIGIRTDIITGFRLVGDVALTTTTGASSDTT